MFVPYKLRMLKRYLFRRHDGEKTLKKTYRDLYGKELDTEQPVMFSEKIFNRLIEWNRHIDPLWTCLSDKYLVRDFVRERVGERYLVDLLWQGTDPALIPFDDLPERCVVKTNHGSGGIIVLSRKVDRRTVIASLQKSLTENYYWVNRESQYFGISRRVLVEQFINDGQREGPLDYRFWCFNGQPELVQIDNHAHDINPFYDTAWNKLPLAYRSGSIDCEVQCPANFQEMLYVAARLSNGLDFVRVDLYNVAGKIYFSELTFTPVAGRLRLQPDEWDAKLGNKWVSNS